MTQREQTIFYRQLFKKMFLLFWVCLGKEDVVHQKVFFCFFYCYAVQTNFDQLNATAMGDVASVWEESTCCSFNWLQVAEKEQKRSLHSGSVCWLPTRFPDMLHIWKLKTFNSYLQKEETDVKKHIHTRNKRSIPVCSRTMGTVRPSEKLTEMELFFILHQLMVRTSQRFWLWAKIYLDLDSGIIPNAASPKHPISSTKINLWTI